MHRSRRHQCIPRRRVATCQETRQHAEKGCGGDACHTVEIHSAATLPGDPGKAEIDGRRCGRRTPVRLQRTFSSGSYDTGPPKELLGKPVFVKIYADGVVGCAQIRPISPGHFVADTVLALDPKNPQVSARLATAFRTWRTLESGRRTKAEAALKRLKDAPNLSRDLADIVERALAAP